MIVTVPPRATTDRLLRWSAVIACITAIASVAYASRSAQRARAEADASAGGYRVGEMFDHMELLSADSLQTLVIWLDPRCGACEVSAGFYRDLVGKSIARAVHVAVAAPEPRPRLDAFLLQHSIHPKSVFTFEGEPTLRRFGLVPAVMLVERSGVVRRRWVGRLTLEQEREVFEALTTSRK